MSKLTKTYHVQKIFQKKVNPEVSLMMRILQKQILHGLNYVS